MESSAVQENLGFDWLSLLHHSGRPEGLVTISVVGKWVVAMANCQTHLKIDYSVPQVDSIYNGCVEHRSLRYGLHK